MRILIFGPWPLERPVHGGQIRAAQIIQAYRGSGHTVQFVGLYDPSKTGPTDYTRLDHPITPSIASHVRDRLHKSKIAFWEALAEEPSSFERFRQQVAQFRPDLIQFEEPFLWPVIRRLTEIGALEMPRGRARILHSSYNVEHIWRREFGQITHREDAALIDAVEALEREIARSADAICVVSESDRRAFQAMGAEIVVVASNGSDLRAARAGAVQTIRQYMSGHHFALYVSSAHPPNAISFFKMITSAPGARLSNGILVVCGDIERLLRSHSAFPSVQRIFRSTRFLGRISPELLSALYAEAHAVIVPRVVGGGSHLKTAEALLSDKPIVATSRAFIGFEAFVDQPGVQIRDEPEAFWQQTNTLLGSRLPKAHPRRDRLNAITWDETLGPMVRIASELLENEFS